MKFLLKLIFFIFIYFIFILGIKCQESRYHYFEIKKVKFGDDKLIDSLGYTIDYIICNLNNKLKDTYNLICIRDIYLNSTNQFSEGETYENIVRKLVGHSYRFKIGTLNNNKLKRILIDFENINVKYPILIVEFIIWYD